MQTQCLNTFASGKNEAYHFWFQYMYYLITETFLQGYMISQLVGTKWSTVYLGDNQTGSKGTLERKPLKLVQFIDVRMVLVSNFGYLFTESPK